MSQVTESQCELDQNGLSEEPGSIPGSASRFRVRIPGTHALRLIFQAGRGFDGVLYDLWPLAIAVSTPAVLVAGPTVGEN